MIRASLVDEFDFPPPRDLQGFWPSTEFMENLANSIYLWEDIYYLADCAAQYY